VNALLRSGEWLYRGVNRLRRAVYRAGILRRRKLHRPVISIGNIAAGGTGKTPAVIAVARHLAARGYRVAVLTRGYGRSGGGGRVETLDAARFGDEPVLIKKSVTNADVIVGSNRYESGHAIDTDVFILDDGFQHLQLHRDLDIVIDAPARFHREGRAALRFADIVLPRRFRLTLPAAIRGRSVFAFSGLADNQQFFDSLRAEGLHLAGTRGFTDHYRYSDSDIAQVVSAAHAAGAEAIVTTEKDAVKISGHDIIAIPAEFEIDAAVLERIERAVRP
jgi:tetraacyldisaccharide 4'-kinase